MGVIRIQAYVCGIEKRMRCLESQRSEADWFEEFCRACGGHGIRLIWQVK